MFEEDVAVASLSLKEKKIDDCIDSGRPRIILDKQI
jgi:hypothetical protein